MEFIKVRSIINGPVQAILLTIFYYFLLFYILNLFYPLNNSQIAIIAIFLGLIKLSATLIETYRSNPITRFLMEGSEIIMWASLIYLFEVIAIYLFQWLIFPISITLIVVLLCIVPIIGIYSYYKAHTLKVNEYVLYLEDLTEDLDIVHFSDVHIGSIRNYKLLFKISNEINKINPDLAIISGDLADGSSPIKEDAFKDLSKSKIPIIFTPGNHDYYPGIKNVINACKNAEIIVLDDDFMDFKGCRIYGMSFNSSLEYFKLNSDQVNILIYHIPTNWNMFSKLGFNIQLSGHTHGGQFYPANLWVKAFFPYLKGLYENKGNYLSDSDKENLNKFVSAGKTESYGPST